MRSILIPLLGTVLFIAILGVFGAKLGNGRILNPLAEEPKKEITVGSSIVKAALANDEEERKQGLSERSSLPGDEGLLFVFDRQDVYPSFWMKEMLIPIDIIWIENGKVVKIDKNIAPPEKDTPESELKLYSPNKPIDFVLEVNAGFSDSNNIDIGDGVSGI